MFGKCNVLHIGVCPAIRSSPPGSTLLINLHNQNASINSNMTGAFTSTHPKIPVPVPRSPI